MKLNYMLNKRKFSISGSLTALIIVAAFFYLFSASWLKWGNLLNDTPRELWSPLQILEGRVPYRDFYYEYGIFPVYFMAFLYRLFGAYFSTVILCNSAMTFIMSLVIYKLARFFLTVGASGLTVLTFLFVFAFGHYSAGSFNFIMPYSFASTFFMLFVALSLYLFISFIFKELASRLFLWGAFLLLAFLSRPVSAIIVWLGFMFTGTVFIVKEKKSRLYFAYLIGPFFAALAVYSFFLWRTGALAGFIEAPVNLIRFMAPFYRLVLLRSAPRNFLLIAESLFVHGAVVAWLAYTSRSPFLILPVKQWRTFFFRALLLINYFVFIWLYVNWRAPFWDPASIMSYPQFMCAYPILLAGIPLLIYRAFFSKVSKKDMALLSLFLISLLLIFRIIVFIPPHSYHFCFFALPLLCYYFFFFEIVAGFCKKRLSNFSKPVFLSLLTVFFLMSTNHYWQFSRSAYSARETKAETSMGYLYFADGPLVKKFNEAADFIRKNTRRDSTLLVFPHGLLLNLATERRNPIRYYAFGRFSVPAIGDERIISKLKNGKIDYIAIVASSRKLPAAYRRIFNWIQDNYSLFKHIEPLEKPPYFAIYKKK